MKNKTLKTTTIILALLLVSSVVFVLFSAGNTVSAQSSAISTQNDPYTGQPYGDLTQYEWTQPCGDQSHMQYSAGPAPNKPDVLWSASLTGISGAPVAFDGKVFVSSSSVLYALNAYTGKVAWSSPLSTNLLTINAGLVNSKEGGDYIWKCNDNYLAVRMIDGIVCYNINTGAVVWNLTGYTRQESYWGGLYSSEMKMRFDVVNETANPQPAGGREVAAFDMSDPSKPATVAWRYQSDTLAEILSEGGGMLFVGSMGEGVMIALNASNGHELWRSTKIGNTGYSATYYNGLLYHTASSTRVTCYNATTGKILWDEDQGGRAFFAYGGAIGYGRYFDKCIQLPAGGFVAAWDAITGEMLWKQPAYYQISYQTPALADGKLYVSTCDAKAGPAYAGTVSTGYSFTCFDAFTGAVIWNMPQNQSIGTISYPAIAFGNLYGIAGTFLYCIGDNTSPWSMWQRDTVTPGVAVGQSAPTNISFPKWTFTAGDAIYSSPAVADGKLYVGSMDKNLYCLNAETGSLIWNFSIKAPFRSSPAVVGGKVYTGSDDGNIYCIDANTGNQVWKVPAGGITSFVFGQTFSPRSSPIIVGSTLVVGSLDGKVYCLNLADGTTKWTYQTLQAIGGSPTYYNGAIYIASTDNYMYALKAADGTFMWKTQVGYFSTGLRTGYSPWDSHTGASPAAANGKIYFPTMTNFMNTSTWMTCCLCAFDANTGTIVWNQTIQTAPTYEEASLGTPTYYNGIVYVDDHMYGSAFNATTGKYIWSQWVGHQTFSSFAVADDIRGAKVYFGNEAYGLSCFNATTGVPISVYTTEGQVRSSPAIWEGKLYVGSADFKLYCFDDSPTVQMSIDAWTNKGSQMWPNEMLTITGKLYTVQTFTPLFEGASATYHPGIPNATVQVTILSPSNVQTNLTATTNNLGIFSVSYTPTQIGSWGWVASYNGKQTTSYVYTQAYSAWSPVNVVSPTTEPTPTPVQTQSPAPTTPTGESAQPTQTPKAGTDSTMTMTIAIAVVVIIVIIAIAALVLRKRK